MVSQDTPKDILRLFGCGLFVATSATPDGVRAATVSWVSQVSFEPRLLSLALRKQTAIHDAVGASGRLVLHVVARDQMDFARTFFRALPSGPGEIGGYRYTWVDAGMPVFDDAPAWLECEVVRIIDDLGDHSLFVVQVLHGVLRSPGVIPLTLRDTPWHYGG